MAADTFQNRLQQQATELCRLLQAGDNEKAALELPAIDRLLLDDVSRQLTDLTEGISQTRAADVPELLTALRTLKLTAEQSTRLLQTIPTLTVAGPHIQLHPDAIIARLTTLLNLTGEISPLHATLQLLRRDPIPDQLEAARTLEMALTRINSRLRNL